MPLISRFGLVLLLAVLANGCRQNSHALEGMDPGVRYSVVFFVAADCPLCKSYKPLIASLPDSIPAEWSVAVVRTDLPADKIAVAGDFGTEWGDSAGNIAGRFGAKVTPEVFIVDNSSDKVLYHGAIDNYAWETGKHRTAATEFFLKDAIAAILKGQNPAIIQTKAIGCFIEP